jgi:hypothetical protein
VTEKCLVPSLMHPNSFSSATCWEGEYICKFTTEVQSCTWKILSLSWSC